MSGRVLVVRHGRTAWNRERFLGRVDVDLDEVGEQQARAVPGLLAAFAVDQIQVSPLRRALATAAPLAAQRGLPALVRPELSELDCGQWQGQLKDRPDAKISKRDPELALPGGESIGDASRRVAPAAVEVTARATAGRSVVVVGHYLVNQLLVGRLLGLTIAEVLRSNTYRPPPGSAYELVMTCDGWRPVGYVAARVDGPAAS